MAIRQTFLKTIKGVSAITDPVLGWRRQGPRLLIYHQVGAGSGLEMDIPPKMFRRQIDWLLGSGGIVSLQTALTREGAKSVREDFVLTLDDGHATLFEHAFPAMAERQVPFVLYLSTEPLDGSGFLHSDRRMPLLNWDQIGEMVSSGLATVGSHSHRHLDMRRHTADEIGEDLATCDAVLKQRLGIESVHFAYPWGQWSAIADPLVRRQYRTAVIGSGSGIGADADLHKLSRIPIMASEGEALFRRKMWGGFRLETGLRRLRDSLSRG